MYVFRAAFVLNISKFSYKVSRSTLERGELTVLMLKSWWGWQLKKTTTLGGVREQSQGRLSRAEPPPPNIPESKTCVNSLWAGSGDC